jgi:glycosyltransferase involved in cell wall biosynthesis
MSASPYLSLILPAYNEARSITATLDTIEAYLDRQSYHAEVLVCADGTDGTREIVGARAARDRRVRIFGEPQRRGKGRGIRDSVGRALGQVIGFMDADNKTPIEELDKLLPWLAQYDLVIGSRAVGESRIEVRPPLHRRLGSRAFTVVMHALTGLSQIHDTQCGFKFFHGEVARDLFARQRIDGYMFDVEILSLAVRRGYRIKEVGVRWRDDGDTRLRLLSGNWQNLIDLLRIRWGSQSPGPASSSVVRSGGMGKAA